jgi:hypothetical protein
VTDTTWTVALAIVGALVVVYLVRDERRGAGR